MSNAPNPLESLILHELSPKIIYYRDEKNENCGYFKIEKEDHTLGHLLYSRLILEKNIIFSGYKKPHPLDHFIFLKIVTDGTIKPKFSFDLVLKDLYIEFSFIEDLL